MVWNFQKGIKGSLAKVRKRKTRGASLGTSVFMMVELCFQTSFVCDHKILEVIDVGLVFFISF